MRRKEKWGRTARKYSKCKKRKQVMIIKKVGAHREQEYLAIRGRRKEKKQK